MTFRRSTKSSKLKRTASNAAKNAPKVAGKATRKAPKAARKVAKNAPPRRSLAIILAAIIGLVAALVAKRFLGSRDGQEIDAPDVERADATWAPEPSAPVVAPEATTP